MITVTVASEAANVASRRRWTAKRACASGGVGPPQRPVTARGPRLATGPVSLRMVTGAYSSGRVAIPLGSRPASTQPMRMAATGMAIKMKNRLFHGT